MNELNISNEALLNELHKRIKENQIKIEGVKLVGKSEKSNNIYYAISLNIDVGNLVNTVIRELKEELRVVGGDKRILESRI